MKSEVFFYYLSNKVFLLIKMLGNEAKPVIFMPKFSKNGNLRLFNAVNFLIDGMSLKSPEISLYLLAVFF